MQLSPSASIIHHVRSICRGWYVLFAPHRTPADPSRLLSNPNRHCKHFCAPHLTFCVPSAMLITITRSPKKLQNVSAFSHNLA